MTGTDTAVVDVTAPGSITVVKQATPDTSPEFGFTVGGAAFAVTDGGSRTFDTLPPGDYTVLENASDGWDFTGISCDDPTGDTTVDLSAGSAIIALAEGENVTCTFANAAEPAPPFPDNAADRTAHLPAAHLPAEVERDAAQHRAWLVLAGAGGGARAHPAGLGSDSPFAWRRDAH